MEVCATDVLVAPAERIWHLLTDPRKLAEWTRTKLVEGLHPGPFPSTWTIGCVGTCGAPIRRPGEVLR